MREKEIIFYEKSGEKVVGEILKKTITHLEVKILNPYYGITLIAKPKMCMLFSDKSSARLSKKILEKCFYLGEIIQRRNEDIQSDFLHLKNELGENLLTSKPKEEELLKDFERTYLNGFQAVPEFLLNPLQGLLTYLDAYFQTQSTTKKIRPETEFSDQAEEILKLIDQLD